jgi:hypothetical protein
MCGLSTKMSRRNYRKQANRQVECTNFQHEGLDVSCLGPLKISKSRSKNPESSILPEEECLDLVQTGYGLKN